MSSSEYIADFNAGFVRDLGYRCELRSVAYSIEEDAVGENGDKLMNNRNARVKIAMGRLNEWVDERFFEAGISILNQHMLDFITRMVAEAMIVQRDQTREWFEPTDRAETLAESLAEQD